MKDTDEKKMLTITTAALSKSMIHFDNITKELNSLRDVSIPNKYRIYNAIAEAEAGINMIDRAKSDVKEIKAARPIADRIDNYGVK